MGDVDHHSRFAGCDHLPAGPDADALRQPVDFYSPDTFNYATLDVNADGTLTVSIFGINVNLANSVETVS